MDTTATYMMTAHGKRNDKEDLKRLEYEAVMQIRDQAITYYELLQRLGYYSGPLFDLRKHLEILSEEVSSGI